TEEQPPRAIPRALPRTRERVSEVDEIVAKSKAIAAKRPAVVTPAPKAVARDLQAEDVNRVVDKISAPGPEGLTRAKRDLLEGMAGGVKSGACSRKCRGGCAAAELLARSTAPRRRAGGTTHHGLPGLIGSLRWRGGFRRAP